MFGVTNDLMTPIRRGGLVIVLAITSGATDAIGILALGSAFTSVMTGNMVLIGVHFAEGAIALSAFAAVAIASFAIGAAAGARIVGSHTPGERLWPLAVTLALVLEWLLFAGYAAGWWATGAEPSLKLIPVLLALNAAALGLQSSAILRFGVPGLSTTYLTGTLTTIMVKLMQRAKFRTIALSVQILCALIIGAALGTWVLLHHPMLVPLTQLLTLGLVIVLALSWGRRRND